MSISKNAVTCFIAAAIMASSTLGCTANNGTSTTTSVSTETERERTESEGEESVDESQIDDEAVVEEPSRDGSEQYYSEVDYSNQPDLPLVDIYVKHNGQFYDAQTGKFNTGIDLRHDSDYESTDQRFYRIQSDGEAPVSIPCIGAIVDRTAGDELVIARNVDEVRMNQVIGEAYFGDYDIKYSDIEELNGQQVDPENRTDSTEAILSQSGISIYDGLADAYAVSDTPTSYTYGYYTSDAKWEEETAQIDRRGLLCSHEEQYEIEVPTIKGKDGYFTLDIASLAPGDYLFFYNSNFYLITLK